jgi:hypothetical protein
LPITDRNYERLNYSQETREDKENAAIRYEIGLMIRNARPRISGPV